MQMFKRLRTPRTTPQLSGMRNRRRFSPLILIGALMTLLVAIGAGAFIVTQSYSSSHAAGAAANPDCTLIVPPNPLSAQGLATPYKLMATDSENGPCHEANPNQSAFVQGAVFDPATGQISIYNPVVVDRGRGPAVAPVVPKLPQNAIVGLWFGSNGGNLTLRGSQNSLQNGNCVNGLGDSVFGQFAYCNAPAFFNAAHQAIKAGKLVPPALGTASDGMTCLSVRDFGLVDMDQSDNVNTMYLVDRKGHIAQFTAANLQAMPDAQLVTNGSDNGLVVKLNNALGCHPWTAPDLASPGQMLSALPLNELQAATHQATPVALVPANDPMVTVNGEVNLSKLNLYRMGVDQPVTQSLADASTVNYCQHYLNIAPARIAKDQSFIIGQPSIDPAAANNLFTFLAQRFNGSYGEKGLNCEELLQHKSPIKLKMQDNVTVDATINFNQQNQGAGQQPGSNQTKHNHHHDD